MTDNGNNKQKKQVKIVLTLLFAAVIAFLAFGVWKRGHDRKVTQERLETMCKAYEEKLPGEIIKVIDPGDLGIDGRIEVTAASQISKNGFSDDLFNREAVFYDVNLAYSVTLYTDESFESYNDRAKYERLKALNRCSEKAYAEAFDNIPECGDAPHDLPDSKVYVWYKNDGCSFFIISPEHSYEYASYVKDYYLYDGEDHFLRDKESKWYSEPDSSEYGGGAAGGSGTGTGSHKYDPYGADDYDDPDSYAEEHIEDFMDEGDDYDEAYEEAYDHWEEWN